MLFYLSNVAANAFKIFMWFAVYFFGQHWIQPPVASPS